jgi:sucrose phosphorylase
MQFNNLSGKELTTLKDLRGKKEQVLSSQFHIFHCAWEDERKLLLVRAIKIFIPGKSQVWYLELFAGVNDYETVKRARADVHKEINRTNLTLKDAKVALKKDVVKKQIELLQFRNTHPAFDITSGISVRANGETLKILWNNGRVKAVL